MWTLVLRAEIQDDLSVTKHIHLLEKDLEGNLITPHKKLEYESFIKVANVILENEIDVSKFYQEEFKDKLTEEELNNDEVQTVLDKMKTYDYD